MGGEEGSTIHKVLSKGEGGDDEETKERPRFQWERRTFTSHPLQPATLSKPLLSTSSGMVLLGQRHVREQMKKEMGKESIENRNIIWR